MKIALASRSPRRRALLKQIGIDYDIIDIDIDESCYKNESPEDYVCRMAIEKARTGKTRLNKAMPVLAADTTVVLDGHILGKAENKEDAMSMLETLSGKTHDVFSAVAIIGSQERIKISISKVRFKRLKKEEIIAYCQTDEPLGKAGAYAIQGKAAVFIERLEGSYSGVMGLPLFETQQLLDGM